MTSKPTHGQAIPSSPVDHDDLRSAARTFVSTHITRHVARWEEVEDFPRALFPAVGRAGWFGLKFAPRWGGSGLDLAAQATWIEELARSGSGGVAADLGAHSELAAVYLANAGSDALKEQYLRAAITGEVIGALAITEPGAGSDVAGIVTRARRHGVDWLLDGHKVYITNGSWCDFAVVAAKVAGADGAPTDDAHQQVTLFVVDMAAHGVSRRRMRMLGWRTSHTGELRFESVRVPHHHLLGEVGGGFHEIMRNFAWERLTMALGAVVNAEMALTAVRDADGAPRTAADDERWAGLAQRVATGRSLTQAALHLHVAAAEGRPVEGRDVLRATAMAKLFTQRLAFEAADVAMTASGEAGTRLDHRTQRWWRDARLGPIGGGTDDIMREIIARTYGL